MLSHLNGLQLRSYFRCCEVYFQFTLARTERLVQKVFQSGFSSQPIHGAHGRSADDLIKSIDLGLLRWPSLRKQDGVHYFNFMLFVDGVSECRKDVATIFGQ